MKEILALHETVIKNGYCVGCGACSYTSKDSLIMIKNENGLFQATINTAYISTESSTNVLEICPFYNSIENEDTLSKRQYGKINDIKWNEYIGYYLFNYAGYVKKEPFRTLGSSGGLGTWIATKLIQEGLVDKVIHVKETQNADRLFEYQISSTLDEIQFGSKSKYYPIEMSQVLEYVKNNDYKYLFIGVPCFIKSLRLLQKNDHILQHRIKFALGLVCGHLKSDFFAKSISWELGVHPSQLAGIDFRVKDKKTTANDYSVQVLKKNDGSMASIVSPMSNIFVSNWGYGFFKYKACDYCDDVLAEIADVTIGDAWLSKYNKDYMGTNIITIRSPIILSIFEKYKEEIYIESITADQIYQSQIGGFKHRREGLGYRLFFDDIKKVWRPQKRVVPKKEISNQRKKIYTKRIELRDQSFHFYKLALESNDYTLFKKKMMPLLKSYNRLYIKKNIWLLTIKIFRKTYSVFKKK